MNHGLKVSAMVEPTQGIISSNAEGRFQQMLIYVGVIYVRIQWVTSKSSITTNIGFDLREGEFDRIIVRRVRRKVHNTITTAILVS